MEHEISQKNNGFDLFKTRFEYCEDSNNYLAYFRVIQGHSGGTTIDPESMGHIPIPHNRKEQFFHRGCSFSIQSILENGLSPGGKESKGGRRTMFFTSLIFFAGDSDEEEPVMIAQFLKTCTIAAIGNVIRMPFMG